MNTELELLLESTIEYLESKTNIDDLYYSLADYAILLLAENYGRDAAEHPLGKHNIDELLKLIDVYMGRGAISYIRDRATKMLESNTWYLDDLDDEDNQITNNKGK